MTVNGSTKTFFILFRSLEEIPSGPQLLLAVRSSIYFCTKLASTHSNSKEHAIRCFRYELIVLVLLLSIFDDNKGPTLAKKTVEMIRDWERVTDFGITYNEIICNLQIRMQLLNLPNLYKWNMLHLWTLTTAAQNGHPIFFQHHAISYGWLCSPSVWDRNYCNLVRSTNSSVWHKSCCYLICRT